jgi:hypothetical protein
MNRELLIEAILDESRILKVCFHHPMPVYHDEVECPCCRIFYELQMHKRGRKVPDRRLP